MNSNQINHSMEENGIGIYMTPSLTLSTMNMSTFKCSTSQNPLPSKPSEVKRRSNHRKQIYAAINYPSKINENETSTPPPPPPPPPPPLPDNLDMNKKTSPMNDFQLQIEQAKTRLKKIDSESSISPIKPQTYRPLEVKNIIIEDLTPAHGFPPPPSPTTLRRSTPPSITDPRLDVNFSSVIAQRAAAAKARRHENSIGFEYNLNKLPSSTTFFNNCITTSGIPSTSKCFMSQSIDRWNLFSFVSSSLLISVRDSCVYDGVSFFLLVECMIEYRIEEYLHEICLSSSRCCVVVEKSKQINLRYSPCLFINQM